METDGRRIKRVGTRLSRADRIGIFRCRVSNRFRMNHSVPPGLYAVGVPSAHSPVLVSANYKFSFDVLRRSLSGLDAWILVIDSGGINVWCAAGKGTFDTGRIVEQIRRVNLADCVEHRRIVVPQLGATGVVAHEVRRRSGFSVVFGPVRAADIPAFLDRGYEADRDMRTVRFSLVDRLVLTPIEIVAAARYLGWGLPGLAAFFGLSSAGILFSPAWSGVSPFIVPALAAIGAGTVLHAALLPFIPLRAFFLKGLFLGAVCAAPFVFPLTLAWSREFVEKMTVAVLMPLLSSFLAFNFTGCTPVASVSGVKWELKRAIILYAGGVPVCIAGIVLIKCFQMGIV